MIGSAASPDKRAGRIFSLVVSPLCRIELPEPLPQPGSEPLFVRPSADSANSDGFFGAGQGNHSGRWSAPKDRRCPEPCRIVREIPSILSRQVPFGMTVFGWPRSSMYSFGASSLPVD
jgi:hypothetical protein